MRRVMREQQDEEEDDDDDDCEEEQKRILYELCSMIFHILHSPPLPLSTTIIPFLNPSASSISASLSSSPAAFASFFLGISLVLMLFGSVTVVTGLVMLSWVVGLVFLFYFVAVFSNLSEFGLSILGHAPTQFPARKSS